MLRNRLKQDPADSYPYTIKTDNPEDSVFGCLLRWRSDEAFVDGMQVGTAVHATSDGAQR